MDQFGLALGSGVIAALLASGLWVFLLTRLRPRIDISPVIAYTQEDGRNVYRVKIMNERRRTVANVRCEMDLLAPKNVKGGQVEFRTLIPLRTDNLMLCPGRRKKDKECKYAFRFCTYEDLHGMWDDTKGHRLVFRVFAQDAVSRQFYNSKPADLKEGEFVFGHTFEVTPRPPMTPTPSAPAGGPAPAPPHGATGGDVRPGYEGW